MDKHIIHAEWIGKHAIVSESTNNDLVGIEGTIVDETKHALHIETPRGIKTVQKKGSVFTIAGHRVIGNIVAVAPEERIKLKVK